MWKEWKPFSAILKDIPSQYQYGLSVGTLKFTAITKLSHSIVIGTNTGLLYFVNLSTYQLNRLKCEVIVLI